LGFDPPQCVAWAGRIARGREKSNDAAEDGGYYNGLDRTKV